MRRSRLLKREVLAEAMTSRKLYVAVANAVRNVKEGQWTIEDLANVLADVFVADNPRFDRQRFLQACGISKDVKESRMGEDIALANQVFNQIKYGGLTTIKTPEDVQGKVFNPLGTMKLPNKDKKVTERPGTGYPNLYGYFMGESKKE